jgi:hypothetical protein
MRTRQNSIIVSLRVERGLAKEFNALAIENGVQAPRKLREAFLEMLDAMRQEADERREINGKDSWETEWALRNAERD